MADSTSTEIVKAEESVVHSLPSPTRDIVVLARTPDEMATAQAGLLVWAEQKLAAERGQLAEKEENLEHARRGKYHTNRWQRQVTLAKKRVVYYEKFLAAVQHGYYIVPAFPALDTVAIRTTRLRPRMNQVDSTWRAPPVAQQKAETLAVGDGGYVSPNPVVDRWEETTTDGQGKSVTTYLASAVNFAEIDFPFAVVKPQILEDFDKAVKLRIFDEISVLPIRRRRGDPMVIGTIKRREGYNEIAVNFLISWWIDTRDL